MSTLNRKAVSEMTMEELAILQKEIAGRMEALREEAVHHVAEEMEGVAGRAGMTLKELLARVNSGQHQGSKRKSVAIKYRNPENPSDTWAGHGRKPKWLETELAKNRSLADFAVSSV